MFATLAGDYPRLPGSSALEGLAAVLREQVEAGMGLLADGLVHPAGSAPEELVAAWLAARDQAARFAADLPVKLAVGGPFAAAGAAGALKAAAVLHEGLAALAAAGCPVVEVHEPAADLPDDRPGREAFVAAHRALLAGLPAELHASLAITGGEAAPLGRDALFAAPYRSHLLDLLDGPDGWRLVAVAPAERGVVVGVGDATGAGRTRFEDIAWAATYAASAGGRRAARVGLAPSAGLGALAPERARAVIVLLGEAAAALEAGRAEVVSRMDPRAVDLRSAALGPRPFRPRDPGR